MLDFYLLFFKIQPHYRNGQACAHNLPQGRDRGGGFLYMYNFNEIVGMCTIKYIIRKNKLQLGSKITCIG